MSKAVNERLLLKFEGAKGSTLAAEWMKAVYEVDRQHQAAATLAKFAQALAGIEPPAPAIPAPTEPLPANQPPAQPRSSRPTWGPGNRPGVHDVLTWEEAMQYFWLSENASKGDDS